MTLQCFTSALQSSLKSAPSPPPHGVTIELSFYSRGRNKWGLLPRRLRLLSLAGVASSFLFFCQVMRPKSFFLTTRFPTNIFLEKIPTLFHFPRLAFSHERSITQRGRTPPSERPSRQSLALIDKNALKAECEFFIRGPPPPFPHRLSFQRSSVIRTSCSLRSWQFLDFKNKRKENKNTDGNKGRRRWRGGERTWDALN